MHVQNLVKFYHFVLKILNGNEILTSFKGHNSITNVRKMMYVCTYKRDLLRFLMVHGLCKFMGLTSQANFNFNMLFWYANLTLTSLNTVVQIANIIMWACTHRQMEWWTEGWNDGQPKSSIAHPFLKCGYNNPKMTGTNTNLHLINMNVQLLSKIFIDSDFCHNYLHTLYLFACLL